MQLFDIIPWDFFKPLTGVNRREYVDIITLIWQRCKRSPIYGESKTMVLDWLEEYFTGLSQEIAFDLEDLCNSKGEELVSQPPRFYASMFLRRLKDTGWLEEREGSYEEEAQIVVNHRVVPIIRSFHDIVSPQMVTYKGKLFKVYKLLQSISEEESPYENILREVSGDLDELNASLQQLAASIGTYMDELTCGKTPEEVLALFESYEEKVVVGAYHRFKTNDNLFYYRSELMEQLELCRTECLEALIRDFVLVEQVSDGDANLAIGRLVFKLEEDLREMEEIIKVIDERHILYRTRAVQRAQFLLLSDGTVKSKINRILRYCAATIEAPEDFYDTEDEILASLPQMYSQGYFDTKSLKSPVQPRRPTPIEELPELEEADAQAVAAHQAQLLQYARNAVTAENVNRFAHTVLKRRQAVTARELAEQHQTAEDIVKIIGLHTYSASGDRTFDVVMKPNFVECHGLRFQDFTVTKRGVCI
ncbi:hypothetical protein D1646_02875 [Pseudoflavonifractor sp. 60]|uniref:Wadjet anti-phage system protein JetA family protein n=1 Tax=Pseudoflavonifractor sp. 60 TaxID=2304576 RepID=UPI00136A1837|nr:Wadjet anti-phage system protein JetA family protein [Pseudoflavonifractor sp. 60]NBI65768.1 hypothetical protein [Pseudoflavonifractor sp. 60]